MIYIFIRKFKRGVRNYEREVLKLIDATCKLISSSLPKDFSVHSTTHKWGAEWTKNPWVAKMS